MKKVFIAAAVVLVAAVTFLLLSSIGVTDPYVVRQMAVLSAPSDAKIGHTVDTITRTLLVVSRKEVVVISDPGASFKYEVLWIIEHSRKDGSSDPRLYRAEMPKFAVAEHIHPVGSTLPPKIAKFATGGQW